VGVQMVSSEGISEVHNAGKFFTLQNFLRLGSNEKSVEWLSGGAFFIPKKVFQELQGFDERFFMYFEDMDICLRLQKKGYKVLLHTEQELIHLGGRSHKTKKSQKKVYDQSLYKYTKKHWPFFQYVFFRIAHPVYRFLFPYGR
jgi:GT2 family glycosyltransferase